MPIMNFLIELSAGQLHLLGVDDDDVVAAVDVRRKGGLVLAAQPVGDDGRETPEDDVLGVDQKPAVGDLGWFGGIGLHRLCAHGR